MQNADIKNYLGSLKSLPRYDKSFRKLYVILQDMGVNPPQAETDQVAHGILRMASYDLNEARNAYSAVLLIPKLGQGVRFHP